MIDWSLLFQMGNARMFAAPNEQPDARAANIYRVCMQYVCGLAGSEQSKVDFHVAAGRLYLFKLAILLRPFDRSIPKDSVNDITCSPKCRPSVMVVRASPYALSTIIILTLISIANRNNQQHTSIHEAATSFFMYLSSSPLIVSIIMWNTKSIPITIDRCVERF